MRIRKNVSKILLTGILLNNFSVLSSAGTLSPDSRYETFDNSSVTIKDVFDNQDVDIVEVNGKTMISPLKNTYYSTGNANVIDTVNDGIINTPSPNGNYFMHDLDTKKFLKLKNNTTYTVFIKGKVEFTDSNSINIVPFYRVLRDDVGQTQHIKSINIESQKYFNEKITFTTNNEEIHSFGFYTNPYQSIQNINLYYHIVEGDYRDSDIEYFEGVKSAGEDKGKIGIISENKNLLDINNLQTMRYSYDLPHKEEWSDIAFNTNEDTISYSVVNNWNTGVGGIYKVKKNTFYTAKYEEATCDKDYDMSVNILGLYEDELDVKYWNEENHINYYSRLKSIKKGPNKKNVSLTFNSEDYDYLVVYIGGAWKSGQSGIRNIT